MRAFLFSTTSTRSAEITAWSSFGQVALAAATAPPLETVAASDKIEHMFVSLGGFEAMAWYSRRSIRVAAMDASTPTSSNLVRSYGD
jgi:hypothetical protein